MAGNDVLAVDGEQDKLWLTRVPTPLLARVLWGLSFLIARGQPVHVQSRGAVVGASGEKPLRVVPHAPNEFTALSHVKSPHQFPSERNGVQARGSQRSSERIQSVNDPLTKLARLGASDA